MSRKVIYVHGQYGSPAEAEHYIELFEGCDVVGLDYTSEFPWEAREEFPRLLDSVSKPGDSVILIANSIGAYFAMSALYDRSFEKAFFISPVVDMEKLIRNMMTWAGVSEKELCEKGTIETSFGQTLSWEYLCYARNNPIQWQVPTHILYGSGDNLTAFETISGFAEKTGASLTVMENGEHWFHTEEQMLFLDNWIKTINSAEEKYDR